MRNDPPVFSTLLCLFVVFYCSSLPPRAPAFLTSLLKGGSKRWTFSETVDNRARVVTLLVCIITIFSWYLFVLVLFLEVVALSHVYVAFNILYQHIINVYWGVFYNHHLCLCDVHLKTCSICCSSCGASYEFQRDGITVCTTFTHFKPEGTRLHAKTTYI